MQWCETTLGEICDKVGGIIQTGPFGSQLHESDYSQEGTPVVMPKDIIEGRIVTESVARIAPEHVERLSRHKFKPDDIVYGRRGDIGRQALIRKEQDGWLCGTGCLRLSLSDTIIEPLFLHYYLRQESVIGWISNQAVGATLPNLNTGILRSVPVRVPPLPVQRRIVSILSSYDDLIENNQRRIKILEEMARSLYREWFVHFRFPGHDKIKMVSSPLGPIPQGWEVKTIADLCESVNYGYTASAVSEAIGPKFLRITDIVPDVIGWDRVPFCEIPAGKAPKYLVKPGDIVIARTGATTGYAKRINKRHPEAVFASYLVRVRAHADVSNLMLGLLMESADYKQFIKTNIGGAAQPQANAVVLTSMRLATPPSPLGENFDRLVEPLLDEAELLAIKIQNLRRTRDLLLPRLLSGQIEFNSMESVA
jgi:type I restriction enzyme, S subunit